MFLDITGVMIVKSHSYDYAQDGAYFVTICTQERLCVFGDVVDDVVVLNDAGTMIEKWWNKIPQKYDAADIDAHVIMPNHFHGIIVIPGDTIPKTSVGAHPCMRPVIHDDYDPNKGDYDPDQGENMVSPLRPNDESMMSPSHGLGRFVSWFKRMSTNEYIRKVKQHDWPPFPGRLWQRNYYERIIRSDTELNRIREYIVQNPANWDTDELNPNPLRH